MKPNEGGQYTRALAPEAGALTDEGCGSVFGLVMLAGLLDVVALGDTGYRASFRVSSLESG